MTKIVYQMDEYLFNKIHSNLTQLKNISEKTNNFFAYSVQDFKDKANFKIVIIDFSPEKVNMFNAGKVKFDFIMQISKKDNQNFKTQNELSNFNFNWFNNENKKEKEIFIEQNLVNMMRDNDGKPNLSKVKCAICGKGHQGRKTVFVAKVNGTNQYQFIGQNCLGHYVPNQQLKIFLLLMRVMNALKLSQVVTGSEATKTVDLNSVIISAANKFCQKLYQENKLPFKNSPALSQQNHNKLIGLRKSNELVLQSILRAYGLNFIIPNEVEKLLYDLYFDGKYVNVDFRNRKKKEVKKQITELFYKLLILQMQNAINLFIKNSTNKKLNLLTTTDNLTNQILGKDVSKHSPYNIYTSIMFYRTNAQEAIAWRNQKYPLFAKSSDEDLVGPVSKELKIKYQKLKLSQDLNQMLNMQSSSNMNKIQKQYDFIEQKFNQYLSVYFNNEKTPISAFTKQISSKITLSIMNFYEKLSDNECYDYKSDTVDLNIENLNEQTLVFLKPKELTQFIVNDFKLSLKQAKTSVFEIKKTKELIETANTNGILAMTANDSINQIYQCLVSPSFKSTIFNDNFLSSYQSKFAKVNKNFGNGVKNNIYQLTQETDNYNEEMLQLFQAKGLNQAFDYRYKMVEQASKAFENSLKLIN